MCIVTKLLEIKKLEQIKEHNINRTNVIFQKLELSMCNSNRHSLEKYIYVFI